MAEVILRGCCKFCAFSKHFQIYGRVTKKTKLMCDHKNNLHDLKNLIWERMTHENGWCENFQWGDEKKTNLILAKFNNMKKEEVNGD